MDPEEAFARRYVEIEGIPWPQVCIGLHSQIAMDYGVTDVPTYVVIGPDGKIVSIPRDRDNMKAAVAHALGTDVDEKPDVQVQGEAEERNSADN